MGHKGHDGVARTRAILQEQQEVRVVLSQRPHKPIAQKMTSQGSITGTRPERTARAAPHFCFHKRSCGTSLLRARALTDRKSAPLYLRDVIAVCGGLRCPRAVPSAFLRGAERSESGAERARPAARAPPRLPVSTCQNKGRLLGKKRKKHLRLCFCFCQFRTEVQPL